MTRISERELVLPALLLLARASDPSVALPANTTTTGAALIVLFVSPPLASLDRLALQRRLDDIGRQGGSGGA